MSWFGQVSGTNAKWVREVIGPICIVKVFTRDPGNETTSGETNRRRSHHLGIYILESINAGEPQQKLLYRRRIAGFNLRQDAGNVGHST